MTIPAPAATTPQQPPAAAPATPPAAPAAPAAQVPPVTPPKPVTPPTPPATPSGAPQTPPASTPEDKDKVVPITALHEEREKRQQLQAQVEAMKRIMANNVLFDANGNPVMQQPQQQQVQPQYQQEIEKLWESDPRKAVQAEIMTAFMWRDQVDAQVEQQASEVSGRQTDFNNFRPEVMTYLRTLPIDQRGRPGMVEAAYYFIKGQKVDNIVAQTRQQWEADYLRKLQAGEIASGLPAGATGLPPAPQGAVTLTQDQKNAAAAMRISEADYAKWMVNK